MVSVMRELATPVSPRWLPPHPGRHEIHCAHSVVDAAVGTILAGFAPEVAAVGNSVIATETRHAVYTMRPFWPAIIATVYCLVAAGSACYTAGKR